MMPTDLSTSPEDISRPAHHHFFDRGKSRIFEAANRCTRGGGHALSPGGHRAHIQPGPS